MRWEMIGNKNQMNEKDWNEIADKFGVTPTFIKLLHNRGVKKEEEIQTFLSPKLKDLHNPFHMMDMKKAVMRIVRAIENKEKIGGYLDYDCDGVTTAAMMKIGFRLLGKDVDVYAPNRYTDGYGLNKERIQGMIGKYDVLITGDTGIRNFEEAQIITESKKTDLIITDHHEPWIRSKEDEEEAPLHSVVEIVENQKIALPNAYAVVNPKRLGDPYRGKGLAGVSIMFKLMLGVFAKLGKDIKELLYYVDLVSVGCIADLAPQIYRDDNGIDLEVRTLSKLGLQILNGDKQKIWTQTFREIMDFKEKKITEHTIGYVMGPMLNAPGRMEDPKPAVDFLTATTFEDSLTKAEVIKEYNLLRQEITNACKERIVNEVEMLGKKYYDYGVVAISGEIEGISGIIASKVLDHFYRPTIIFAESEEQPGFLKGSARSIKGVHMLRKLEKVEKKIGSYIYGGHAPAAGMTIEKSQLEDFREAFRDACMEEDPEVFERKVEYEDQLDISEITFQLADNLSKLEPFGINNEKPIFRTNNVEMVSPKLHGKGEGIGFSIKDESSGRYIKCVFFERGKEIMEIYKEALQSQKKACFIDLIYSPSINEWENKRSLQLMVQDLQITESAS